MKTIEKLILGALAVAGACVVQADQISYLDPVFDSKGAVSGYETKYAECTEINWGYNPASGGIIGSGSMTLAAGWYVVSGNFQISSTLTISGDVRLILRDGAKFEVNYEDKSRGGLRVESGNSLTIYAQSEGGSKGQLYATGGKSAAGIGSGSAAKANSGKITINGGYIKATGGHDGAGIGGGDKGSAEEGIRINGGEVVATGGDYGPGIGGGCYAGCKDVEINGGTVTVQGGAHSSGIGGGGYPGLVNGGDGTGITINGGTVTATGGEYGAGIGGANGGDGRSVNINGGTVTATGGHNGAGIGGGGIGEGEDIMIRGGTVKATGGECAAGIGGGKDGPARNITIDDGTVTVQGGKNGAGIGSGQTANCEKITINGGSVTAIGGNQGAGIGSGYYSDWVRLITINGGTVNATGGNAGAGIGGGSSVTVYKIEINGGLVTATGGTDGPGIGGGSWSYVIIRREDAGALRGLAINGGTIRAKAGSNTAYDIGHGNPGSIVSYDEESANFVFTGGSITTLGEKGVEITPTNGSGAEVHKTTVTGVAESPAVITGLGSYGVNDLYPDNGNLHLWLPSGSYSFRSQTKTYSGSAGTTINSSGAWYGIAVNGVEVGSPPPSGVGWSCVDGVLTLSQAKAYTLTGTNTAGNLRISVTANANVTLDNVTLSTTNAVTLFKFTSAATDATLTLKGESKIYSGANAFLVEAAGAKVTILEDSQGGCLVGSGNAATGRRFCHNNGTLVLKGGTIKDYHAPKDWAGGALYNSGTFTMNGGTISGCAANLGGALYNVGTTEIYGGTFADCSALSQGSYITSKSGKCDIYGGYFAPASGTIFDCFPENFAVHGGVTRGFATGFYDGGRMQLAGSDLTVYGRNMAQANGQLTGGTYTFNPTNDEYAAVGVTVMGNCTVTAHPETTPKTYSVHLPSEFYVNGVKLTDGPGEGWTFEQIDANTGLLTLNGAMDYALSGYCNVGLKVDVTANAKVALTDVRIHAGDLGRAVFNVTASDARFSLGGSNEVYTTDGSAAIGVAAGAKLTLDGDGALVGGKAVDATCLGVSVNGGTFVMNGVAISGYKGGSYGGGLYIVNGTAELNTGTITDCAAHFGGALALLNKGTVDIRSGMVISGNSAASHGAVFLQGGTVNVWGGTFTDNTVYTGVLTDWAGALNVYGGVFADNSVKPVHREGSSAVAVSGGVYDVAPEGIVSGSAATQVGDNHVVGQGVTQEGNALTGGTFTFDPSRAEYTAAGLAIAKQHMVETQGTDPETYRVHVAADFKVNGVRLEDGAGAGWSFTQDGKKGTLTLTDARAYALSGYADLTLLVDVLSNATVTLNGARIRAGAAEREVFNVTAEDATFVLKGVNEVYASDGHAAIGVGPFAKLTVTGNGELVGGKAANDDGRGFTVAAGGGLVIDGGTIRDYYTTADGGAVYNAGTFTVCGGTLSGNVSTVRGGAICNAGTVRIYGGRFLDNATTGDLSWGGFCFGWTGCQTYIYGGCFSGNRTQASGNANLYIAHGRVTDTGYLFGGVFAADPTASLESSGCLVLQGGAAVTQLDDLHIVGQDMTQAGGALTGGTYTFNPTDDLYADAGVAVAAEHVVLAQATDPATYAIDWNWTDFTVDGVDLVLGSGDGWSYDKASGLLSLDTAKTYVLSGALTRKDLDLGVTVETGATVVLSNATITSTVLSPLTVNAAGVTVRLKGDNRLEVAALDGASALPAMAVSDDASVTIGRSEEVGNLCVIGGANAVAIGGEGDITIACGVVEAQGGIAGGNVRIEGGTVSATGRNGNPDIDGVDVRITGGSVVANSVTDPKNAGGASVWCVTVPDVASRGPVAITNVAYLAESYGQADLYPISGALCLWLPNGTYNGYYVGDDPTPYYAVVDGEPTVAIRKLLALYVNDELVTAPEHAEGWSYADGVLTLDATTNYVVTGESMTGDVRIVVADSCDLALSGVRLGMGDKTLSDNLLWIDAGTVNLTLDGATAFQVNGSKKPIGVNAGATLNICGSGTAFAWGVDVLEGGRVTMEDPTALTFTTQASAEAAAAVVKPVADESEFPGIDQVAYGNRFVVSAVAGESGMWTLDYQVSAATSNELRNAISSVSTLSNLVASISSTNRTASVTFTPIPGFYYGMAGATEVTEMDSDAARPPAWYAGQEGVDLTVSGMTFQDADKAFYQLKAAAKP